MGARIGFYDVDSLIYKRRFDKNYTDFPNYALMKLARYHVNQGDSVSLIEPMFTDDYDKIYASSVFTWTEKGYVTDSMIKGGTGFKMYNALDTEIDDLDPYYELYPEFKGYAIGFLTRGCSRKCEFCVVPVKEGGVRPYWTVERVARDNKKVVFFDNNVLAIDYGKEQIEQIIRMGLAVDFNQGLDARYIDRDTAKLLSKVKWIKFIRTALDFESPHIYEAVERAITLLHELKVPVEKILVYILTKDDEIESALRRIKFLEDLSERLTGKRKAAGIATWVCPFVNPFTGAPASKALRLFARWSHTKKFFYAMEFDEFLKYERNYRS